MNKETKEKIQNLQKEFYHNVYKVLLQECEGASMYDYCKKGLSLHSVASSIYQLLKNLQGGCICQSIYSVPVDSINIEMIKRVLDKLTIPREHQLTMHYDECFTNFGKCDLNIITPDGARESEIWKYIEVEDSCMGAWQAYLLYTHYGMSYLCLVILLMVKDSIFLWKTI